MDVSQEQDPERSGGSLIQLCLQYWWVMWDCWQIKWTGLECSLRAYQECSIMRFTEMYLQVLYTRHEQQKWRYHSAWCIPGHFTVKAKICTQNIELLAVSLHPYYRPKDSNCVNLVVMYILCGSVCDVIFSVFARLQTQHCTVFIEISTKSPSATPRTVNCSIRENKNLFYTNLKRTYRSFAGPPLGKSEHLLRWVTFQSPIWLTSWSLRGRKRGDKHQARDTCWERGTQVNDNINVMESKESRVRRGASWEVPQKPRPIAA